MSHFFVYMAVTKQKKIEIAQKLDSALANAGSVVFVQTKGLKVSDAENMRNTLKKEGVSYYVAKKTLVARALGTRAYDGVVPVFPGELALAWGDDLVAPAREIQSFVKSTKEKVTIVGGVFEGRYMSASEMTEIASIPSQHTLYAQFAMLINSPLQQFVVALDQIAQKKEA
jgi:large subunit ribosomal protein L10